MRLKQLFAKRRKKKDRNNLSSNHTSWGRTARMESLEDRRMLANYFVMPGESIQDAIDSAQNDGMSDTIFLKSGNYNQQLNIRDNDPLKIVGLGNVYLNGGDFDGNIVDIENSHHVTLKNLTIRYGNDDNVDAEDTYKLEFYNVHSIDSRDDGVDAERVDYVYAYNSKFNSNDDNGMEFRNVGHVYLKDVQASYNGLKKDNWDPNDNNGISYVNLIRYGTEAATSVNETEEEFEMSGVLDIYSGDFSKNKQDGIHTSGVKDVYIDTIYANDNRETGLEVGGILKAPALTETNGIGQADKVHVNYAAFDANGEDGAHVYAYDVKFTETRALHNDGSGVSVGNAYEVYVHNSDYSYNGLEGLEIDHSDWVTIDYIQANHNGQFSDDTGLSVDGVEDLTVHNSQFLSNIGDGIYVNMYEYGHTLIDYVDSSYNTGDGIDLRNGSANIETVRTNHNDYNGIRSVALESLYINDSTSKYNGYNGLKILGGRKHEQPLVEEPDNGNGFHGTNVHIVWSDFSHNYKDGIHAENVGSVVLERMSATYNGDDGYESINPYVPATVIDSVFEHNYDQNFVEYFNT